MRHRSEGSSRADLAGSQLCITCPMAPLSFYSTTACHNPDWVGRQFKSIRRFKRGELILWAGQISRSIFVINSGWVTKSVLTKAGERRITDFRLPGEVMNPPGLSCRPEPVDGDFRALTEVTLCEFRIEDRSELLAIELEQRHEDTEFRISCLLEPGQALGRHAIQSAEARIAMMALGIQERLRRAGLVSGGAFDFPVNLKDLANATGLTVPQLRRGLATLRRDAALTFSNRRMEIQDMQKLKGWLNRNTAAGSHHNGL